MNLPRFLRRRRYLLYPGELADMWRHYRAAPTEGDVENFEDELADYLGARHVITMNSGRVSLLVLLEAMGLKPGDEILVPAYTLRALVELLANVGYVPVAVDLEAAAFNMDPENARAKIGPKTRAILATHMFGQPCDIETFRALADEKDLLLVEDCAQALGAEVNRKKLSTFGDGAILSFDLLKTINTFGGGAITTSDDTIAERARQLRAQSAPATNAIMRRIAIGLCEHAAIQGPTGPLLAAALAHPWTQPIIARSYRSMQDSVRPTQARFSEIQAHLGRRQLHSLDGRVSVRSAMGAQLSRLLGEGKPASSDQVDTGYFFVRECQDDPRELRRALLWRGIDAGIHNEVADYCGDFGDSSCPRAKHASQHAIQLPLHEGLFDGDLERIAKACRGKLVLRQPTTRRARAKLAVLR